MERILCLLICCCLTIATEVHATEICVNHSHPTGPPSTEPHSGEQICVTFSGNKALVKSTGKDLSNVTTLDCKGKTLKTKKDDGLSGKTHTVKRRKEIAAVCVHSGNNTDKVGPCKDLPGKSGGQLIENPNACSVRPTPTPTPDPTPPNDFDCDDSGDGTNDSLIDECGVCAGDNSTCVDCEGKPNGHVLVDECGICGGDGSVCEEPPAPEPTPTPTPTPEEPTPEEPTPPTIDPVPPVPPVLECPLVTVELPRKRLLRRAKELHARTTPYLKRIRQCDASQRQVVRQRTRRTNRLLRRYINILNSIPRQIETCECVRVTFRKQLRQLRRIGNRLYRQAGFAQRGYRTACKVSGPPRPETVNVRNELRTQIQNCNAVQDLCPKFPR